MLRALIKVLSLRLLYGFAVCVFVSARGSAENVTIVDATARSVVISDQSRIVSVGGAITEILYALGAEQQVVAIDTTSVYPEAALRQKPNVGYMRQLSPEGILGLSPTLILAAQDSGPKETVAILEASGVPFVLIPDHFDQQGVLEKIDMVARAAGLRQRGECLAGQVKVEFAALASQRERITRTLRVLFVLSLANDRATVAGRATAADGIIRLAGAANAIDGFEGYKIVNDEAIIAARPDVIVSMQRGQHALTAAALFANPAFALTPAAQTNALVSMEGLYLLGFGPRTAGAALDLADRLYPGLARRQILPEGARPDACKQ